MSLFPIRLTTFATNGLLVAHICNSIHYDVFYFWYFYLFSDLMVKDYSTHLTSLRRHLVNQITKSFTTH